MSLQLYQVSNQILSEDNFLFFHNFLNLNDPGYAYWDRERSYNLKNDPDYLNSCKYRGGVYQIVPWVFGRFLSFFQLS